MEGVGVTKEVVVGATVSSASAAANSTASTAVNNILANISRGYCW